jgi:hypothetical protein
VHEDIGKKLIEARLIDAGAIAKAQQQMKSVGGGLTATLVKIGRDHGGVTPGIPLELLSGAVRDLRTFEPDLALTRSCRPEVAD